jgi:hypothetical protein
MLLRDLDSLQQVHMRHNGNDWLVRTDASKTFGGLSPSPLTAAAHFTL